MTKQFSIAWGVCILLLCPFTAVFSQAGAYSFSTSSGTYTPLGSSATSVPAVNDDEGEADVPIGFDFEFEGVSYDTVAATSNGFLSFVPGATSVITNNLDNGSSIRRPLVAPLWDDHDGSANTSAAAYEVTGTAPNRVFTFEWRDWEWRYNSTDSVVSFQVKLFETSNEIQFTYRWECSSCRTSPTASIGLSGTSTFLSVTGVGTASPTASNTTEDSSIDTVVTDQIFTFSPPTCPQPTALSFANISAGSVDIDWTTGGASAWQISYDTTGNAAGANITNVTTAPPFSLSGLPAGVPVDVYVRDSCAVGDVSAWGGPVTVTLPCGSQTAPYSTGFESFIAGYDPFCWSSYASSGSTEVVTSGSPYSGSQQLELDGTTSAGDTLIAITPQFSDLTSNDKQVRFYAKSTSIDDTLFIGTLSSLAGTGAFTMVDTVVFTGTTFTEYILPITTAGGYNGNDEYVVFMHSLSDGGSIYIDDFYYEVMPPCPKITQPNVVSVGLDSAVIGFATAATSVDIEWGPIGFGQGTGCTATLNVVNGSFVLDNDVDPSCISTIMENSCYDVYIRNNCTAQNNGVSIWEGPITFCTPCDVQALPFSENFDNGVGCFTILDSGSTDDTWFAAPAGYTRGDLDGTGYILVDSDAAGSVDMDEYAVSPVIDASSVTGQLVIEFDQYFNSWSSEDADVEVWDGSQWVTVLSQSGSDIGSWTSPDHQFINVTSHANADFQVRFHYHNANYEYYWAIDNFQVHEISCLASSDLAAYALGSDSIALTWNPGDGASYGIEYGSQGFTPGSGNMLSATDTFAIVRGLSAQTAYDFYLYDTCATGYSTAFGPVTFTTPCVKQNIPFTEGFDTDLGCFIVTQNGGSTNDTWEWVSDYSTFAGSFTLDGAPGFAFVNSDAAGSGVSMDEILTSPSFDASSITGSLILQFDQYYNALGDTAAVDVWDGTQWVNILKQHQDIGTFGTPDSQYIDVTAYANADFKVRFHYYDAVWAYYWAIDNFSLTTVACGLSSNLDTGVVTSNSAELTWSSNASMWNISWGPQGFTQGTNTGSGGTVIRGLTSMNYNLSGLGADSCYSFYVQDTCVGSGAGQWVGPFNFCTPPTCPAPTDLGVDPLSLTINSADVYWKSGGANHFNVEYDVTGFSQGTGNRTQATNDTLTLSSLSSGTEYEFYVRDSCSTTDTSDWSGPVSFVTPFTTNYLEDFGGSMLGWEEADGRLTTNTQFTATSSSWTGDGFGNVGSSGAQKVNVYTSSQYEWLISPSIYLDPAINNLQVEFDVAVAEWTTQNQGYFGSDDTLALVISTDNGATWSSADILWYADANDTISATGDHIVVPVNSYSGYVRFGFYAGSANDDSEDNDWFVDNFEVRTPRACANPGDLSVSDITTDSALVTWTEGTPGFINAEVFVTTGNQPAHTGTVLSSLNDSVYLTGLTNATSYCVYVVEECANGFTDTLGPVCFSTKCLPQSLPYNEDFNSSLGCFSPIDSGTTSDTWMHVQDFGGSTLDGTPFAFVDSDAAGSGNTLSEILESVQLDASNFTGAVVLTFDHYFRYISSDEGFVEVYDGSQWNVVANYTATQGGWSAPQRDSIDISAYANAALQVRFRYEDNGAWAWYWAVDNVSIREVSTCPAPTNFTANVTGCDTVEISWSSDATVSGSHLEYGPVNFTPGSGTVVTNVSSPYQLTGLGLNTEYEVYLMDTCNSGLGTMVGPVSFKTDSLAPVLASFAGGQIDTTMNDATSDFDASASTGDGLSYSWDFGDGNTGTGQNVQYAYTSNGTYNVVLTVTDRCGQTDDTTIAITVGGISIVENVYGAEVAVYPNPASGEFKVNVTHSIAGYSVEVVDLTGKRIFAKEAIRAGVPEVIDLGNAAPGVYFVRFTGEGLNVTQRVVIK